jgi:hypothetical protein
MNIVIILIVIFLGFFSGTDVAEPVCGSSANQESDEGVACAQPVTIEAPECGEACAEPVETEVPDCGGTTSGDDESGEQADGCVDPAGFGVWEPVSVGDIDGVIVPESEGSVFVSTGEYWTPSPEEIAEVEAAIAQDQGELVGHNRQYVGFYEEGEPMVYVNGFCDSFGMDWEVEPVLVDDGGECYFTAVYNMVTGDLERFDYNGEG